jgi:hypothetical protein
MPTGIYIRTPEHSRKMSEGLKKRYRQNHNFGFKKGVSTWKGKKLSAEHRQKLSKAHKGKKMHPNTRAALAKALVGNTHTLGVRMPDSMREKTSARLIGNKINLGRIQSKEERHKRSLSAVKGSRSHFWKGGITPINQKIRSSLEYNDWEREVIGRDGGKCLKCGYSGQSRLVAHHIKNFAQFPSLRFILSNGATLCRSKAKCHMNFHKIYGRKNNNLKQLKEFLK